MRSVSNINEVGQQYHDVGPYHSEVGPYHCEVGPSYHNDLLLMRLVNIVNPLKLHLFTVSKMEAEAIVDKCRTIQRLTLCYEESRAQDKLDSLSYVSSGSILSQSCSVGR